MAAHARKAHKARPVAPQAPAPTEDSVTSTPKPSIWTRVKTAAAKTAAVVAKPFQAVARKVASISKTVARKVASVAKTTVTKIADSTRSFRRDMRGFAKFTVAPRAARLWRNAFRPILQGILQGVAIVAIVFGLTLAPLTTVLVLAALGLGMLGLARGVQFLEDHERSSRLARLVLRALEIVARILLVGAYAMAALAALAMALVSWPFALFLAIVSVAAYYESRLGVFLAFVGFSVLTGDIASAVLWILVFGYPTLRRRAASAKAPAAETAVPEYSELRRKPDAHSDVARASTVEVRPSDAPHARETWTRGEHLTAKGTEELWGTEHDRPIVIHDDADEGRAVPVSGWDASVDNAAACDACGASKGALRIRSHWMAQATVRTGFLERAPIPGTPPRRSEEMFCSACYQAECEDFALKFTGVSLEARSVDYRLNQVGTDQSVACAVSKALVAGTVTEEQRAWLTSRGWDGRTEVWDDCAWYRDARGVDHVRARHCLLNGEVVGGVEYDHRADRNRKPAYQAKAMGGLIGGRKRTREEAEALVADTISDEQMAVKQAEREKDKVVAGPVLRSVKKS